MFPLTPFSIPLSAGRIGSILASRLVRHFLSLDEEALETFYKEYSNFVKEGILTDPDAKRKRDLAKLLRFETAGGKRGELKGLAQAGGEATGDDKAPIYYLVVSSREIAETSPYLEPFKAKNIDVFLMYSAIDEYVMAGLGEFEGRKLVSAERGLPRYVVFFFFFFFFFFFPHPLTFHDSTALLVPPARTATPRGKMPVPRPRRNPRRPSSRVCGRLSASA
jgi:hypothetical protein